MRGLKAKNAIAAAALGAALLGAVQFAHAVELDPGDYTALPDGMNAVVLYGQYAKRNALYANGDRVPVNARLDSTVGILRYLHVARIDDRWTVDPQFLLPFGELKAGGDLAALGRESGVGDLILATAFKYKIDAKAGEVFGFTPFLWLPTGTYDRSQPLNLGEHRWKAAFQLGYTRPLAAAWRWDLIGDVTVYGRNDQCAAACGSATDRTFKQDPLYHLQTHLRYEVSPALSLSAAYGHIAGGRTEVDGVEQPNRQRTDYVRFAAGYFVTPTTQILTTIGRDLRQQNGLRENARLNLRLLTLF